MIWTLNVALDRHAKAGCTDTGIYMTRELVMDTGGLLIEQGINFSFDPRAVFVDDRLVGSVGNQARCRAEGSAVITGRVREVGILRAERRVDWAELKLELGRVFALSEHVELRSELSVGVVHDAGM